MNSNLPTFGLPSQPNFDPFAAPTNLARLLLQGGQGYVPTDGFHIYTELRTTERAKAAEDDRRAAQYIKTLTDYVNFGSNAATVFNVTLLEAQGEVLHFFKEGPRTRQNLIQAVQFVYLFTREAYAQLKNGLGGDWQGLASSLDGGQTVILRHANYSSSSAISLAPAANRPAKRLLYGGTKAGNLDLHKDAAALVGLRPTSGDWHEMGLRDRQTLPFADDVPDAGLGRRLAESIQAYRSAARAQAAERIPIMEAHNFAAGIQQVRAPQRVVACSVRCDLDGFSSIVQQAFTGGAHAPSVQVIVAAFLEILRFGDHMLRTTQGAIQLPWAGDCATTIIPDLPGNGVALPRWLEFAMRWHEQFAQGAGEVSERTRSLLVRNAAKWAVGGCHGDDGVNILAPVPAQGKVFLIGAGWPVAMSLDAQNLGKGDEIVTRKEDYGALDGAAQSLFRKVPEDEDFWKTRSLTQDKLRRAAIEAGKSSAPNPKDYLARVATITVPAARPYVG